MTKIKCSSTCDCKCERCIEENARRRKRMSDDLMDALMEDEREEQEKYEASKDDVHASQHA